ncbi:MAG: hypothetical protein K8W52_05430 [Deltaproteobacteria bacterium]|nr:hypothetical protein [Deltaproteobacteria bacterium]
MSDQPADAVGWGPDGIVTAESGRVAFWRGDKPDRSVAFDANTWGWPKNIVALADGSVGVAAARFDRAGALVGDPKALADAMVAGLTGRTSAGSGYRVRTASWDADGERVWVGVEQRPRRGSTAPMPEPRYRDLLLDGSFALVADASADEAVAWQHIVVAGGTAATAGGPRSIWKAGTATRTASLSGAPGALAVSADGQTVVTADGSTVHTHAADGPERARWDAGEVLGLAASSRGTWVATGSNDHVRLWRVDGASARLAAEVAVTGIASALAFSPDDQRLVIGAAPRAVVVLAIEAR